MVDHEDNDQTADKLITERIKSYSLGLVSVGYFWVLIEGGGVKYVASIVHSLPHVMGAIIDPYVLAALFAFGGDLIHRGIIGRSWFNNYGDGMAGVWSGSWRIFVVVTGVIALFMLVHLIAA